MVDTKHTEYLKKLDHDYSMRGDIEDIGRIKTTSHQSQNSTKFNDQKNQKHERDLRHILEAQEALQQFNDILDQLEIYLNELEALKHQSILAQALISNQDVEGSVNFLIKHHNLNPDDLDAMSSDEIIAVMMNIEGQNQETIESLKSDIKELAHEAYLIMGEHFDANNPQHQAMMNRLEDMETRAKNLDTDFDKVLEGTLSETEIKYSLLTSKMDKNDVEEREIFSSTNKISDEFNAHSLGVKDLENTQKGLLNPENKLTQNHKVLTL